VATGDNAGLKVGQPVVYLANGAFADFKVHLILIVANNKEAEINL
jgi:hypothetical protein